MVFVDMCEFVLFFAFLLIVFLFDRCVSVSLFKVFVLIPCLRFV